MRKQAAIYDPYLDTLGGGERYCLTVAEILLKRGYHVDIFWSGNPKLIDQAQQRFSLDLKDLNIIPDVFGVKPQKIDLIEEKQNLVKLINHSLDTAKISSKLTNFITKIKTTRKYDLIFYLSDGSTPFLFAKKNFLHIQVPFFRQSNIQSILADFIKLKLVSKVICNSKFTARFQKDIFKNKVSVLYPPVDLEKFDNTQNKENIILSVGRFDNILNAKKQDILIDSFRKLVEQENVKDWKLILAGGSLLEPDKNAYLKHLKDKAEGLPIEFAVSPDFKELQNIYSRSSIYWHAAGFEVDENKSPENTEHFGITIVEAMTSGLVPVVIDKGGIPEIIENGVNGYLWSTTDELVIKTKRLIENTSLIKEMSRYAISSCDQFSKNNFEKQLIEIIGE